MKTGQPKVFAFCLVILVCGLLVAAVDSNFSWQDAVQEALFVSLFLIYWEYRGRN